MKQWLFTVSVRLLLCGVVSWIAWLQFDLVGLVFCAPLLGIAFAKPILELIGGFFYATNWTALRKVQGRHFAHRGIALDVLEHTDSFRWISTADVRKVIPGFPGDASLFKMFPADVMAPESSSSGARIKAERLHEELMKSQNPDGIKFRNWLERELIFPASRARDMKSWP